MHFLLDPWFVFPFGIFIILVSFAILYFLKGYKLEASFTTAPINSTNESSIYEKMYGEKTQKSENSLPVSGSEKKSRYNEEYLPEEEYPEAGEKSQIDLSGESYKKAVLIQKEGPNPGRQYVIHLYETAIGKSETNDLVLWDTTLSPHHAKIKTIRERYVLFDMVSEKGVYLNGKKLLKPKILSDFDEIRMGKTTLIFRGK